MPGRKRKTSSTILKTNNNNNGNDNVVSRETKKPKIQLKEPNINNNNLTTTEQQINGLFQDTKYNADKKRKGINKLRRISKPLIEMGCDLLIVVKGRGSKFAIVTPAWQSILKNPQVVYTLNGSSYEVQNPVDSSKKELFTVHDRDVEKVGIIKKKYTKKSKTTTTTSITKQPETLGSEKKYIIF